MRLHNFLCMENLPLKSIYNRYCDLGMQNEGNSNNEQDPGNPNHSIPSLVWGTVASEKDLIGDSLLWGTKATISHPDFSLEEFTAYRQIAFTRSLRGCWAYWILQITICSNIILCKVCGKTNLNTQKRPYIPHSNTKSPGAQVMFSSVLPGRCRTSGKGSQVMSAWLCGWYHTQGVGFHSCGPAFGSCVCASLWDSPDEMGQKVVRQQAVQNYMENI